MTHRCLHCGKECDEDSDFCSDSCEKEYIEDMNEVGEFEE